jgi:hypothetical protein
VRYPSRQSEDGRRREKIKSRIEFLMEIYKRKRKYKIGWGDLKIV